MKKMLKSMLAVLTVAGALSMGMAVNAADTTTGSAGAQADTDYTLEEMLTYAIEDEYIAQAEYDAIMDKYGVQKPFSNIIRSEANHISLLLPLLEEYNVAVPDKNWEELTVVPETIEESYKVAVTAEEKNIAMYESFIEEDLPDDVQEVFEDLKSASENHLTAFQNHADGQTSCGTQGSMGRKGGRNNQNANGCNQNNCTGTNCTLS